MEACSHAVEAPILVSEEERENRTLSDAHLRQAVLLLHTRGYVVLKNAVPHSLALEAKDRFNEIYHDCVSSKNGDGWYQKGIQTGAVFWERNFRWRIFPKLRHPFNDSWILTNPLAMQVVKHLLGSDIYCKFVSSDTCLKGAKIQAPHRELGAGDQWQPRTYVINIPMSRCGLDNGPLEVWYTGSHLWRNEVLNSVAFKDDLQDEENPEADQFASMFPSRRMEMELGDVLIRDPGLLHRGTVNTTDEPRSMLTICLFKKGETHSYGDVTYNLDPEMWTALEPGTRDLFAHAFEPPPAPVTANSSALPENVVAAPEAAPTAKKQGLRWPWQRA